MQQPYPVVIRLERMRGYAKAFSGRPPAGRILLEGRGQAVASCREVLFWLAFLLAFRNPRLPEGREGREKTTLRERLWSVPKPLGSETRVPSPNSG